MPFTPFHFGPGLLIKGLAPRSVSWTAFVAANVVIDCESLYYLERGDWHVHRHLHTFVGAAIAGVVTAAALLGLRLIPRLQMRGRSEVVRAEATVRGIVVGAMAGALTHPVLDGVMHADIEPLLPWSADNPLHGLIGLGALHLGCLICGLVGVILLLRHRFVGTD